jgi:hypothetical protein
MTILVGCSGWSYDDWVDAFYPVELANKKGEWFNYYAQYFSTVEINSTFYRPPGELPGFLMSFKLILAEASLATLSSPDGLKRKPLQFRNKAFLS